MPPAAPPAAQFDRQLAQGLAGERAVQAWVQHERGLVVLPLFELAVSYGRGPRLVLPDGTAVVAPDMLAWGREPGTLKRSMRWIEVKAKDQATWHRGTACWQTGMDADNYRDYARIQDETGITVWIACVQRAIGTICEPAEPTGLFMATLGHIRQHESHRYPPDAPIERQMAYWPLGIMRRRATIEELDALAPVELGKGAPSMPGGLN